MNFTQEWWTRAEHGFEVMIGVMLPVSGLLYLWFRRSGWLYSVSTAGETSTASGSAEDQDCERTATGLIHNGMQWTNWCHEFDETPANQENYRTLQYRMEKSKSNCGTVSPGSNPGPAVP
jgi:hypothetical protein